LRAFARRNVGAEREALATIPVSDPQQAWDIGWRVATFTENFRDVAMFADRLVETGPNAHWRAAGHMMHAHLLGAQGRFREAETHVADLARLMPHWGVFTAATLAAAWPGRDSALLSARPGLIAYDRSNPPLPVDSEPNALALGVNHRLERRVLAPGYLLQIAMLQGDSLAARRYAGDLARLTGNDGNVARELQRYGRLIGALRGGDAAATLDRQAELPAYPLYSASPSRVAWGDWLARSGRDREALGWYRGVAEDLGYTIIAHAIMHFRLAQTYRRLGVADSAALHAERFAEIWRDADPGVRARPF
jgi:hypothetical protein